MNKVCVVLPVYNVEKYIDRCMDSIVNQTYKNLEIIVVDDGSPDNSKEIIKKYIKNNSNIKYYYKENGGLSDARNYGLLIAKSTKCKYIIFIDSDDYIEKNMIEKMVFCLEQNNSDIVVCNIIDEYEKTNKIKKYENKYIGTNTNVFKQKQILFNRFCVWNKLYRISLFEKEDAIFPVGKIYEDLRLNLKIFTNSKKISYIDDYLYHYIIRDGSIMTGSNLKKNLDILDAFDDIILYYKQTKIYNKFENEIEFLAIEHILIACTSRVLRNSKIFDIKANVFPYLNYMSSNFANYETNSYIDKLSFNNKLFLNLVLKNKFYILRILLRIKDGIKL